jgi:hypothetical protein
MAAQGLGVGLNRFWTSWRSGLTTGAKRPVVGWVVGGVGAPMVGGV